LYWIGLPALIELESAIASPMGAFVPGGPLVLISGEEMLLVDADSQDVKSSARAEFASQRPIGIRVTLSQGQFAVLGAKGEMTVYRGLPLII
jgi:hypothetical protein